MDKSEKAADDSVTRRDAIKKCLVFIGVGLAGLFMPAKKTEAGYGLCW
jgi:hypothetical protein